jgi:hypothetical protein
MLLVSLVLALIVIGVLLWLDNRFIPMQGEIKGTLNGVGAFAMVFWLLKEFGPVDFVTQFRVGDFYNGLPIRKDSHLEKRNARAAHHSSFLPAWRYK